MRKWTGAVPIAAFAFAAIVAEAHEGDHDPNDISFQPLRPFSTWRA